MSMGWGCIDGVEVELWGVCYNINETTILNRYEQGLEGSIPDDIGLLTNLISIILPFNNLIGEIPDSVQNLSELRVLDLRNNQISGNIEVIDNLSFIQMVLIGNNLFEGQLSDNIGQFNPSLRHLEVENNNLDGSLPESICDLAALETLLLNGNNFDGEIPENISNLSNLEIIALFNNQFQGQVPQDICQANQIEYIIIENNSFCPPYPDCIGHVGYQDISDCYECMQGDANSDLIIDILDIILMLNIIIGDENHTDSCTDMNSDGLLDILDILIIINIII